MQTNADRRSISTRTRSTGALALIAVASLLANAGDAHAGSLAGVFAGDYVIVDLGPAPGVPGDIGGIQLLATDSTKLLVGGASGSPAGALYEVEFLRGGGGDIVALTGASSLYAAAPHNGSSFTYGPGDVLFVTDHSTDSLLQFLPGSIAPDKVIDLTTLGLGAIPGTSFSFDFVPSGIAGGGGTMNGVTLAGGDFFDLSFVPDGGGTFDLLFAAFSGVLPGGPGGMASFDAGAPGFATPSVLVTEQDTGIVAAYELDMFGNPDLATRREFITGAPGVSGVFVDPFSGNFVFSTIGDGLFSVKRPDTGHIPPPPPGIPEPASGALFGLGLVAYLSARRRRRRPANRAPVSSD